MTDNGFNKACPSGNHMEDGKTPYDDDYIHVTTGDIVTNEKTGMQYEIVDIDHEYVTLMPYQEELTITHKEFEDFFVS